MGLLWSLRRGPHGALATPPEVRGRQCWDPGPGATWGHTNAGFARKAGTHLRRGSLQGHIWQNSKGSSQGHGRVIPCYS